MTEVGTGQRWWEFYFVRYAMGSIIGAMIVFLLFRANPYLTPLLFGVQDKPLEPQSLTLLLAYGLVFCYISSAPILVMHAARFRLSPEASIRSAGVRAALLVIALVLLTLALFFCFFADFENRLAISIATTLLLYVVTLQLAGVWMLLRKPEELFRFYKRLSCERKFASGGIVESYRHLREHGNSFLIVVCEVLLGVILFVVVTGRDSASAIELLRYCSFVLLGWTSPAALIWVVATSFELQFARWT